MENSGIKNQKIEEMKKRLEQDITELFGSEEIDLDEIRNTALGAIAQLVQKIQELPSEREREEMVLQDAERTGQTEPLEELSELTLLVSNKERTEYDLFSISGIEKSEVMNILSGMEGTDRTEVESALEAAGAVVSWQGDEESQEFREFRLNVTYDRDTKEIADVQQKMSEQRRKGREQPESRMEQTDLIMDNQELEGDFVNQEEQLLKGSEDRYGIYQLKDGEETRDFRYMGMDYLEEQGIEVERNHYNLIYSASLEAGMTLDDIWEKFNIDRPEDFQGHSLSISDVVVLHQNGENTSHYVDRIGFQELPKFIKEKDETIVEQKKSVMEQEETETELPELSAEAEKTELSGETERTEQVSYYVIEDISTWKNNSVNRSELERFDNLSDAMARFMEYRGRDRDYSDGNAKTTLGVKIGLSEFDLLYMRENEHYLVQDFLQITAAQESNQFKEDLQTVHETIGFDKISLTRDMTPEEVKDFVRERFVNQLKQGGLEDISLYMERFDSLYEQGRMEGLMPTANQKRVRDVLPISDWKNFYLTGNGVEEFKRKTIQPQEILTESLAEVTLTVAECGEFPSLGEYHEGIKSVEEAIEIFNQIPPERMNGIPSIGIQVHQEGTESYEDTQLDIFSGQTIDLEILSYVPEISGNARALEIVEELIERFPDASIIGELPELSDRNRREAAGLAAEIDAFAYEYDVYQYRDSVEDRQAQVEELTSDIQTGESGYLKDFLQEVIKEGADSEDVEKAKELLERLAEYKPLSKVEELEEANYNMIDNVLNNEKPKKEEHTKGRVSIKEKLAEKRAELSQSGKQAAKEKEPKEPEKKPEREI